MRLKSFSSEEDVIVCHNSKLASGGSAAYVSAADQFLRNYIFREGSHWPDVIVSSGYLTTDMRRGNLSVKVRTLDEENRLGTPSLRMFTEGSHDSMIRRHELNAIRSDCCGQQMTG